MTDLAMAQAGPVTVLAERRNSGRRSAVLPAPALQPNADRPDRLSVLRTVGPPGSTLALEPVKEEPGPFDIAPPLVVASASRLPDPARWGWSFVRATLEARAGRRPAAQLQGLASATVFEAVRRSERCDRGTPAALRTLRACELREGVAELAAVVAYAARCVALAGRLEAVGDGWRCVSLEFVALRLGHCVAETAGMRARGSLDAG